MYYVGLLRLQTLKRERESERETLSPVATKSINQMVYTNHADCLLDRFKSNKKFVVLFVRTECYGVSGTLYLGLVCMCRILVVLYYWVIHKAIKRYTVFTSIHLYCI